MAQYKTPTPAMPSTLAGGIPNYLAPIAGLGSWSRDVVGQMAGAFGTIGAAAEQAKGNVGAARESARGTSEAGRFGALGGLAQAMAQDNANRYGAYAAAEGNRQTAMANEAGARYGSYGMAEAARQTALGNLGSAALGAYGSNANQAMQAWSQNQQAYNNALAQMQGSSQSAMSGLGQSRNAALGQLGSAYSSAGTGLGAASAVGDLSASFGGDFGGGFNAYDPTGTVASGNLGGGGFYGNVDRSSSSSTTPGMADATFGGLSSVGQNLMAGDITGALMDNANQGLDSLNAQHSTSRMMPSQMQGQTFADLLTMGDQYIAPTMAGMNEFYANTNYNRPDFASGMNQFYGAMDSFQPDYSGVLDPLTRPTRFSTPSLGAAPTAQSLFGDALFDPQPGRQRVWQDRMQSSQDRLAYDQYRNQSFNARQDARLQNASNTLNAIHLPPELTGYRLSDPTRQLASRMNMGGYQL